MTNPIVTTYLDDPFRAGRHAKFMALYYMYNDFRGEFLVRMRFISQIRKK